MAHELLTLITDRFKLNWKTIRFVEVKSDKDDTFWLNWMNTDELYTLEDCTNIEFNSDADVFVKVMLMPFICRK